MSEKGKSTEWDPQALKERLDKATELREHCKPAKAVVNAINKLLKAQIDGKTFSKMTLQNFLEYGIPEHVSEALGQMALYFTEVKSGF